MPSANDFVRKLAATPASVRVEGKTVYIAGRALDGLLAAVHLRHSDEAVAVRSPQVNAAMDDVLRAADALLAEVRPGQRAAADPPLHNSMWQLAPTHACIGMLRMREAFELRCDPASGWQAAAEQLVLQAAIDATGGGWTMNGYATYARLAEYAHRFPPAPPTIGDWIERLTAAGLSVETAIRDGTGLSNLDELLDRYYTRDATGNGRLVVSAAEPRYDFPGSWPVPGADRWRQCGIWNAFSFLYYDRATVRRLLTPSESELEAVEVRPLAPRWRSQLNAAPANMSVRLGPVHNELGVWRDWETARTIADVAARRALVLTFALVLHRAEHGSYPATLDPIVDRVPTLAMIDAFTGEEFTYEPIDGGRDFVLGRTTDPFYDLGMGYYYSPATARGFGGGADNSYSPRRLEFLELPCEAGP